MMIVFNNKVLYPEDLNDCDVNWFKEWSIKSKPDLKDPQLELHSKAKCCGGFNRVIYSYVNNGGVEVHKAFCGDCANTLTLGLRHEIKDDVSDYKLYFGKYKGKELKEVPNDYLSWCVENIKDERVVSVISKYLSKQAIQNLDQT